MNPHLYFTTHQEMVFWIENVRYSKNRTPLQHHMDRIFIPQSKCKLFSNFSIYVIICCNLHKYSIIICTCMYIK